MSLGIIEEDPSTTSGMISILNKLRDKVPDSFHVPLHGDQKLVAVASYAKMECAAQDSPEKRLTEILPVPQDFHLRSLVMKVCISSESFTIAIV